MADKPKTQMEEIEQILENEDQYYPPEEDLLRGGKELKDYSVEQLRKLLSKTKDEEERKRIRKEQFLRRQADNRKDVEKVVETDKALGQKLRDFGNKVDSTVSKAYGEHKAKVDKVNKEPTPDTPTPLLDTEEKRSAAGVPSKDTSPPQVIPPKPVVTDNTSTSNKDTDEVQSAEKRMALLESNLSNTISKLRSDAADRMNRRDWIQAIGNIAIQLVSYLRLSNAPKSAMQPAIQMAKIDFSNLNDREMKLLVGKISDLKDQVQGKRRDINTDIVTQRQFNRGKAAPKMSQDEKDRRAKLKELDKAETSAIKNIDNEKKIVNELAAAGMDLDTADTMVNKWYRWDLNKEEKLRVIRNFFESRRAALNGTSTAAPQGRTFKQLSTGEVRTVYQNFDKYENENFEEIK